jgi:signal transduction histidine kinase/ActR/RegA family two-component response regulator
MPSWILPAASALLLAGLAVCLWIRRPTAPLWPALLACHLFALLWVVGDLWASRATTLAEKQIALALLFSGSIPITATWWAITRRYVVWHGFARPWLNSRWAEAPAWFAAAAWLLMITNPWHGQFLTPVLGERDAPGWGVALMAHGSFAIVVVTIALSAWATRRHPSPDVRHKMGILALASLLALVTGLLYVYVPTALRGLAVGVGLVLASAIVLYGIQRRRLFNPLPIALPELLRRDPAGTLLLDRGGRLLLWNPAAEGLLEDLPLEPELPLLHTLAWRLESARSGERMRSSQALIRMLTEEKIPTQRHVFRYVGGSAERWLQLALVPIPSRRGELAAVCLRIEDVTVLERVERERRTLAEQARHAEKSQSLGLMAGGVAHDFNNLLTAIGGHTDLALDEASQDAPVRKHLEAIRQATELAAEWTQQLLAYAGRTRTKAEPVALSKLVADSIRPLASSLPSQIALRTELAEDVPVLEGASIQLRELVMHLVTNAAEAIGEEPGVLTIRTGATRLDAERIRREGLEEHLEAGEYALLEVGDSGGGMDADTRRRIFEPFFSTKFQGRGRGLVVVFGIVRAHRGAISVESEPGRGTTFRVWLPAAAAARAAVDQVERSEVSGQKARRGSGTILVVDDQASVRRLARAILERAGFHVLSARDGADAVARYREHAGRIRLVLLDLTMPEMGGAEALRAIRRIDAGARVLLSSGFDEVDALSALASEGIGGFVHKPYRPDELLAKIHRALDPALPGQG